MSKLKRNLGIVVTSGIILGLAIVLLIHQPRRAASTTVASPIPSLSPQAPNPTEDVATACHGSELNLQVQESASSTAKLARFNLIFTNTSGRTCTLTGAPTATLLNAAGQTLGQPAATDTSKEATTVVLVQGGEATASLSLPSPSSTVGCSSVASRLDVVRPGGKHTLSTVFTRPYCPGFAIGPITLDGDS